MIALLQVMILANKSTKSRFISQFVLKYCSDANHVQMQILNRGIH